MSCVCVLTPVVIAAWPAFSAAVVSAAASLGYTLVVDPVERQTESSQEDGPRQVNLEVAQSEIVTDQLGRDQRLTVGRDKSMLIAREKLSLSGTCTEVDGPRTRDSRRDPNL